jgi:hypothetical protein
MLPGWQSDCRDNRDLAGYPSRSRRARLSSAAAGRRRARDPPRRPAVGRGGLSLNPACVDAGLLLGSVFSAQERVPFCELVDQLDEDLGGRSPALVYKNDFAVGVFVH